MFSVSGVIYTYHYGIGTLRLCCVIYNYHYFMSWSSSFEESVLFIVPVEPCILILPYLVSIVASANMISHIISFQYIELENEIACSFFVPCLNYITLHIFCPVAFQIAQACKPFVQKAGFWGSVRTLARGYEIVMGMLLFTPVAFLAWFPFVSEFQTRMLFNQAFSRGLQISRILGGQRKDRSSRHKE